MVRVHCPSCSKSLNVPDSYAGKKAKCPACQETLTIPLAMQESAPVAPQTKRQAPPPVPDEDPQEVASTEVTPSRRPRDDYDDRPRRRVRSRGDAWADSPNCGANEATRVHWTFWGGMIGPAIINTVRCGRCSSSYNGVHGDYNTTRIAIYMVVSIVLGLAIAGAFIAFQVMN